MKKGFLLNSKSVIRRFSGEEKGEGIALDKDLKRDNLKCLSPHNMFFGLDPLEIDVIKDILCDDFLFDWETVAQTLINRNLDVMDEDLVPHVTSLEYCRARP